MGKPHSRRLVRRSMPYGPELAAGGPRRRRRSRPVGYFLCGDLETQFEFIQRVWVNKDFADAGLRGTREPIMGGQPDGGGTFTIRTANGSRRPIMLHGLPTLVTTRGSAYCLLPGIGGLRYLASLRDPKAVHHDHLDQAGAGGPDPCAARAGQPAVVPGRMLAWWGRTNFPTAPSPLRP